MLEVIILGVKGHFLPLLQLAPCEIAKHKHVLRMHAPASRTKRHRVTKTSPEEARAGVQCWPLCLHVLVVCARTCAISRKELYVNFFKERKKVMNSNVLKSSASKMRKLGPRPTRKHPNKDNQTWSYICACAIYLPLSVNYISFKQSPQEKMVIKANHTYICVRVCVCLYIYMRARSFMPRAAEIRLVLIKGVWRPPPPFWNSRHTCARARGQICVQKNELTWQKRPFIVINITFIQR